MTDCPPVDQLLAFATGDLAEARAAEIEVHIDECSECRAVLSNQARGGPPPSLGRYRIDTVLGSGGMGIVYRAFDPQLARPVAIKVVRHAGEDAKARARLVREAQALARLSHPNVCHVYDVGTEDDEVWVAMELIDGVQLRQWASEGRTRDEVLQVMLGAAEGIAAAHAAGLVHRDIKPENVLVTRDGRAIVTDFGLARHEDRIDVNAPTVASDPHLTQTGAIAGTPAYLAPEQLLGDPLDARVDQFAWAVMAWELLVGARPFPVVFAVRVEAIRAGVQLPRQLSRELGETLAKAMSAAPDDRFPSMRELIDAIKAHPVAARTTGAAPRATTDANTGTGSSAAAAAATPSATTSQVLPRRGRTAAIAGLLVAAGAAAAFAVGQWKRPASTAPSTTAPAAAPTATTPTTPPPETAVAAPAPAAAAPAPAPAPASPPPAAATSVPSRTTSRVARAAPTAEPARPSPAPPAATPPAPVDAGAPPATGSGAIRASEQPSSPVQAPPRRPAGPGYCRSCQVATVDAFCRIPTDFSKPGTKNNYGVVDWGTVTKVETETGTFRDEPLEETIITLRGQRKTYRFTAEFMQTRIDTQVGALLAICPEGDSDLYRLAGGPTDLTRAVITLSAPPRILPAAKLGAQHIQELKLAAASLARTLDRRLDPAARYLVRGKIDGVTGQRYRMDRYYLQVPAGMKNESLLEPGKTVWMVVERPEIEENAEGEKYLVVHAAAILEELFP